MGWELRHGGKWYLYRNRRVNGKPVKEYLAAAGDWGEVMADDLDRLHRRQAKARRLLGKERQRTRKRIDGLLAATAGANTELRVVAEGVLCAIGFRRHNRGEWRMKREMMNLKALIEQLKDKPIGPNPLVKYDAPGGDAAIERYEHAALFPRPPVRWRNECPKCVAKLVVRTTSGAIRFWRCGRWPLCPWASWRPRYSRNCTTCGGPRFWSHSRKTVGCDDCGMRIPPP